VPTYQYACTACGHELEAVQSFSDESLTECPTCAGRLRKVFGSVGVVFKGSGFYRTDSRSESASAKAKSESAESSATSTTSSSETSSASDTKDSKTDKVTKDSKGSSTAPAAESKSPKKPVATGS
jgi:putative FmdB family regulatory protein